MKIISLLALCLWLAGCNTDGMSARDLNPNDLSSVCQALVGPIHYNSQKLKSPRHAGPVLAPDLKQRNQIGQALHCPQFR